VNLLLDTHALLWWLAGESLQPEAAAAIAEPDNVVYVSAASIWEISIKRSLGKLRIGPDLVGAIRSGDFEPLPIALEHADAAGALPPHHRDPFDRMLIAQAQLGDLVVVTRDPAFDRYGIPVLRC
jgi:PIN domain nuclease of toxin-antitoxin system